MSDLEYLLNILKDPGSTEDQICEVTYDLRIMEDEKIIDPLISRLTQEFDPPWVRGELITALVCVMLLSGSDSPEARDLLLGILSSSEDALARGAAALGLGEIGDIRAVEPLLEILDSGEPDLTYSCAAALGDLGDPRAIDPLIKLLKVNRPLIPQAAAQGLGKFGASAKKALPALQKLAEHGNKAEKRFALEAIAAIEQDMESQEAL